MTRAGEAAPVCAAAAAGSPTPASRLLICTILALLALAFGTRASAGEVLLRHGKIFTARPEAPWAESLLISDSTLVAVGTDREVAARAHRGAQMRELAGATVIPGIVDSHAHLLYGALALHGLNLSTPEHSLTPQGHPDEIVQRLKAYAAAHPDEPVIFARADFSATPPTTPSRTLLDRAVPDRPVIVHNTSEHSLWVNTAALTLAGIGDWPLPDGEEERGVVRDASGHPLGVVLEAGMEAMERAVFKRLTDEQLLPMLAQATRYLNGFGITTVVNATGNLRELGLFAALKARGELTVRTRTAFGAVAVPHHLTPLLLADLEEARRRYHDDWVSANLVKFFLDGYTGLIPPLVYEPHEYAQEVQALDQRGFQIMTHAIRDDSVRLALDTYGQAARINGPRDRRFRIEHLDTVAAADVPRFGALQVIPDMQPTFCCAADVPAGLLEDAEPNDRWQSLIATGARLAFSSDWPCTWPPDPFVAAQQAVTRAAWRSPDTADIAGAPLDGAAQGGAVPTGTTQAPEERITVQQALTAYTAGSSYAAFMDGRVGTLAPGKEADLVILSQDPFTVPPGQIARTRVVTTMVAGKIVYTAP